MKKISLYIPCLNAEKTIENCIKNILNQTYPVYEILVIDNNSTDTTIKLASKYRVKILKQRKQGLASVRNLAFKKAKNEFVAAVDADCIIDKKWLENLMKNFTDNVAGVGGNLLELHNKRLPDSWRESHMNQNWGKDKVIDPRFLFGSNCVFKKSTIEKIGLYNEKYKTNCEDVDISKRLKNKGYKLIYEPEAIAKHLRKDTIFSILKSSWRWTFYGFKEPINFISFLKRAMFNFYKTILYIYEDIKKVRLRNILIDFLILPTHTIYDFNHFTKIKFLNK